MAGRKPKTPAKPKDVDAVDQLGKDLAADHTLEKARAAGEPPVEEERTHGAESAVDDEPIPQEAEPLQPADADANDPHFVGEFETFDAVRAFSPELVKGDLSVVNGALIRYNGELFETLLPSIVDEFAYPADHIEAFSRGLSDIERTVLGAEFESGSLLGSLVTTIVTMFKGRPKHWHEMSQLEQRDLVKQLENHAKDLVKKVVRVVAEGEVISITGKLEKYTHAGGFDLKITALSDEDTALQLYRMQGHEIVIRSADAEPFLGAEPKVRLDPDQPEMFADDEENLEPPADDSDLAGEGGDEPLEEPAETGGDAGAEGGAQEAETEVGETLTGFGVETVVVDEIEDMLEQDAGTGDYESRTNPEDEDEVGEYDPETRPMDEPHPGSSFEEASEEELAAQAGRGSGPAEMPTADYVGPAEPTSPVRGESWLNTTNDKRKYWDGTGWYLNPPRDEAAPAPGDNDFPDDPA